MIPLDGYSYLGVLGQPGYFGEVHRAKNILSGELVAIKHVDGGKLAMSLDAWSAEAKAMAACNHNNLVRIRHAEITPDGPAVVMDYLEDGSWEGRAAGAPGSVVDVVDLGIDLCWGLHHLHGQGLVHRDIKPGNVLLRGRTGVLADFGLTGLDGTEPPHQYVPHTPPEARIAPFSWTVEADVYALGVTLYRMLCGDSFSGYDDLDVSDAAALARWPDRQHWPMHVHQPLKRALRAAMHPDPSKRPQSAARLRDSLQRCRPMVSFHESAPGVWLGDAQHERWRVDLEERSGGKLTLVTLRDKGNGFRAVGAASVRKPSSPKEVRRRASEVINCLASTGNPAG